MPLTLGAVALATALLAPHVPSSGSGDSLRVLLIVDDTAAHASLVRGATLGAEEAAHTGAMFGSAVVMHVVEATRIDSISRAVGGSAGPSLIIAAGTTAACARIMELSAASRIPVLNAGCASATDSATNVYSLLPALPSVSIDQGDTTRVELWSATLEKFGGEQLNERFRRRFGARMDSPAWTGWFAMKVALDIALRSHSSAPAALLRQLADPRSQFDGQKGRPLHFDPVSRRLVQPVYRVAGHDAVEHVVGEVAP